jgi:hypothetical protein
MARHSIERARRDARRRPLSAIRHTQQFNIFTEHKKIYNSSKGSGGFLTTGFNGVADGAAQRARERRHATRGVEIEREGCCSARLAAHFVEQPAGTTKNSKEGFNAVRRGGRRAKNGTGRGTVWALGWGMEQRCSGSRACHGACARAQGILGVVAAGRSWSSAATEGGLDHGEKKHLRPGSQIVAPKILF